MLEIQLWLIFGTCAAIILINGLVIVKSVKSIVQKPNVILIIPVTENTEDMEFIVRNCVYRFAEEYPETMVILINFGAKEEDIRIFEKLMEYSCRYKIINSEECSENICKLIDSVIY